MSTNFIMPVFKELEPKKINESIRKIKSSKYYKEDFKSDKPSVEQFKEAFEMLKKGEDLWTKHYRILSYSIDVLEKEDYLEKYHKLFLRDINDFIGYRGFVRPLLSYIYNFYHNKQGSDKIFYLSVKTIRNLDGKLRFEYVNEAVRKYTDKSSFLKYIEKLFTQAHSTEDIEELLRRYFITETDKFYFKCMMNFIIGNFKNEELFRLCKSTLNIMNFEMQQDVFKAIMDNYLTITDINLYPDRWFSEIGRVLQDPYARGNKKWDRLGEKYKDLYRRWNNSKYLYSFFDNDVEGNRDRLNFWKKYINSIYRIENFKDINNALVMEFKNHVMVEFADVNNALYVYKKNEYDIDIDKIRQYRRMHNKTENLSYVKNRILCDIWQRHGPNWQFTLEMKLIERGYKQDRW